MEDYLHKIKKEDKGKLFGLSFREAASFNCWRGYQAFFKIENDSLFLSDITECFELNNNKINFKNSKKRLKNIFGKKLINNKVFVNWYS